MEKNSIMKKLEKGLVGVGVVAGASIMSTGVANAYLTGITLDLTSVETLTGMVITGLAVIWGIRKVIKTVNRS